MMFKFPIIVHTLVQTLLHLEYSALVAVKSVLNCPAGNPDDKYNYKC